MASNPDGSDPAARFNRRDEPAGEGASAAGRTFKTLTGQSIAEALDIRRWQPAERLAEHFSRLEAEIQEAVARESHTRKAIREQVFPLLGKAAGAPLNAGLHQVRLADLRDVQASVLFSGYVQAVDGASVVHQTLPITIVQTAVALANYLGENGTWGHRIFQSDLRLSARGALDQALAVLQHRAQVDEADDIGISDMLRRGLMMHAEFNVLATQATAPWRMGHGHPLPKELLTGTGMPELIELSLPIFHKLLIEHQRFVFVPRGTNDQLMKSIGGALLPLEFAIVRDVSDYLNAIIAGGHYGAGRFKRAKEQLDAFQALAQHEIVAGVFRVSAHAPAQVFYAHAAHAPEAALVAMADAVLVEARGFPMLLDVAGNLCREMFPPDAIFKPAAATYARAMRGDGLADFSG